MLRSAIGLEPAFAPVDVGAGLQPAVATAPDMQELTRRSSMSRQISASFGEIIGLMMRAPQHRFVMLAELEWLVLPAIASRQFRVAEGVNPSNGAVLPVAAVMWASVSQEVDKRLAQTLDQPIRLKPEEWRSGDIVWIIEAVGDPKGVTAMLQHLKQTDLKDRMVRMRVRGKDGKPAVGRVELQPEPGVAAQSAGATTPLS